MIFRKKVEKQKQSVHQGKQEGCQRAAIANLIRTLTMKFAQIISVNKRLQTEQSCKNTSSRITII